MILGVSGSIAAYKAPLIVREMVKCGIDVQVVMSASARHFVSALVLENLSRHPVIDRMFDRTAQRDGSWHVALARWCEAMLIAPCSAATLARLAGGQCDHALSLVAMCLPSATPLYLAPAMDSEMWLHPATQRNCERLRQDGARIIPPEHGQLASGLMGPGRLPEAQTLLQAMTTPTPLAGRTVLITAGPTREKIDDVRFLSNHSTGKMGYALADEALRLGARVILVSGPVALRPPPAAECHAVESAQQMLEVVMSHRHEVDLFVMAAAVADFRPAVPHPGKLKKETLGEHCQLALERTPDILAEVGRLKESHQRVVGFALEAADYLGNARRKLEQKNCDLVVLNASNQPDSGFGGERNTITLLGKEGWTEEHPALSKLECARIILGRAAKGP